MNDLKLGPAGKIASVFINSKLTPLFLMAAVLLGLFTLWQLPREEEPQIVVPIFDVFVSMPGASPKEVERRVTDLHVIAVRIGVCETEHAGHHDVLSAERPGEVSVDRCDSRNSTCLYQGDTGIVSIVRVQQSI